MDPISHVVFGYCCATTVQRTNALPAPRSRGRALAVVLGSLSPDIDALMMAGGWDRYLAIHEIGTHSAIGSVACGALAAGLAAIIRRPTAYRVLTTPALVGALSHVAADLLSGASIRVGWPFVDTRVGNLGVVAMAEPVFVFAAVVAGIALLAAGLLGRPRLRSTLAVGVLCALALLVARQTNERKKAEAAYRRHPAAGAAVGSHLIEPVWRSMRHWHVADRTAQTVRAWTIDEGLHVTLTLEIPLISCPRHLIEASITWDTVSNFRRAHDLTFAVATAKGVEWSDVRYCTADSQGQPRCAVWAGGEFSEAPNLARLVVRVGDLVQTR
jgi:membrane-bound metal-dependent hydrolase YbcI (DUF457 family)